MERNWTIGKFGGGVWHDADSVRRCVEWIEECNINIVVVSAFGGQTRILQAVCEERNRPYFDRAFVGFHEQMWKSLCPRGGSFKNHFKDLLRRFEEAYSVFTSEGVSPEEAEMAMASILALGEDFSTRIVHAYLSKKFKRREVSFVDARSCIITVPGKSLFADIEHKATQDAIVQTFIGRDKGGLHVIQGFVASDSTSLGQKSTTTLCLDGSDLTAAALAGALTRPNAEALLIYFKRFTAKRRLFGMVGIRRLLAWQEKFNVTIVSPLIIEVPRLPKNFLIYEYHNPAFYMSVAAEPLIVDHILMRKVEML